jgi:hypothetical protein
VSLPLDSLPSLILVRIISSLFGLEDIGFHVEVLKELIMKRLNQPLVDA